MRKSSIFLKLGLIFLTALCLYLFFQRFLIKDSYLVYPEINFSESVGREIVLSKANYDKYVRSDLQRLAFDEKLEYRVELVNTDDNLAYKSFFDKDMIEIKSGFMFQISESILPSRIFVFVNPKLSEKEVAHELNRNILYGLAYISEDSKKTNASSYVPKYNEVRASLADDVKAMHDDSSYFLELK